MTDNQQTLAERPVGSGMKVFLTIWFGQLISLLGSGLSGFSLGLWVLQNGGSVTKFALISMFTVLPGILLSPLSGALVDRWDRRRMMIVSEAGAGCGTLALAALLFSGRLEVWHIYLVMSIISTFSACQWTAFTASTTLLVPKGQLANASGLVQLAHGLAKTAAPVLAGILVSSSSIRIEGVLLLDTTSYVFSVVTLLVVSIPRLTASARNRTDVGVLLREIAEGWRYLTARPELVGVVTVLAGANFVMGFVMVLATPLVLSFASAKVLGTVMSTAGVGMFVGSVVISVWGGPKRRMNAVLGFLFLCGLSLLPAGFPPSAWLIAGGAFVFLLGIPIINGCSQAILQSKVAPEIQGRVFSLTGMAITSSLPLAILAAGPLADRVFEPWLSANGPLSGSVGQFIGVGPGRGIAFLFMVLGTVLVLGSVGAFLSRPLRTAEERLPDAIPDSRPDEAACLEPVIVGSKPA